jgi:hypothetical protein
MEKQQNPQAQNPQAPGERKKYKCAKCGKEKYEDEGMFVYGGTTFCCEECCKKDGEKSENMCEFC